MVIQKPDDLNVLGDWKYGHVRSTGKSARSSHNIGIPLSVYFHTLKRQLCLYVTKVTEETRDELEIVTIVYCPYPLYAQCVTVVPCKL